jgi:hypothetical protein
VPLQNRVTPFGEIVAIAQRGLFTGNRGILHDPATRTLLRRRWTNKAWIICRCDFRGVRRQVMGRRSWTELFFHDEAVALAAGHRPCYYCRRESAARFAAAWASAHSLGRVSAQEIDGALHPQRVAVRRGRLHVLQGPPADLPDGAMVGLSGEAYLVAGGAPFHWSPQGYSRVAALHRVDGLLTPPSTVATLRAGYACVLHPSIAALL